MRDRGKARAIETTYTEKHKISDFNYSLSSDMPCIQHPNSSPIGICSFCLKDKLLNLLSSDHFDTHRNSSSAEVGSVGRISFLLENEKMNKTEQVILLRSSSNSVEIKKNRNGFWKIKRLFKKIREKGDDKSEVSGPVTGGGGGVSRSRSLCSFRGGGGDDGSDYRFSSAKISDVTGGLLFDYADHDHVVEPRKSESGGDFKNLRKKYANSESLCCSDSPNMLPILQKHTSFRGSDTYSATFFKSPSNVNSDRGLFFPVKESDFGNTMDYDGDFKNLRKKIPNSESLYCSGSPNMLPILQKDTILRGCNRHSATFLKSPSNLNSDRENVFPVKESDFGNDDGDFKNLRKKFPNSDSVHYSDSSNTLSYSSQVLQKRTTSRTTSFLKSSSNRRIKESDFLKSSSNANSDRGIKESDFDDDDDSAFIDLKLDLLSSSSSTSLSEPKLQLFSDASNLRGGSCRMNGYDTSMKQGNSGKGNKVWKWISRKKTTTSKRDEINSSLIIKS